MSKRTAGNRLFIVSSLKRYAGFYQQLISGVSGFKELGNRLISEAETALAFRQMNELEEFALLLASIPIKEYQLIGQYYFGLCAYRKGQDAHLIFENVIENSDRFKVRAMISLAAVNAGYGNYDDELRYFAEAAKYADSVTSFVKAYKGIAVVKAKEGYHNASLKDLEALMPLARLSEPLVYYDYLNSLAVELSEAGQKEEARTISRVVLASPFAYAYPEWQGTANDLRGSKRSFVAFNPSPFTRHNVLLMPAREQEVETKRESRPARVLNLQNWKKKMGKEPNGKDDLDLNNMTDRDMLFKIIELSSQEDITDDQLRRILQAVLKITSNRP